MGCSLFFIVKRQWVYLYILSIYDIEWLERDLLLFSTLIHFWIIHLNNYFAFLDLIESFVWKLKIDDNEAWIKLKIKNSKKI